MALISRLGVVLGLDSAEFNAGLGKAEGSLNKFSTLAKGAAATAIAAVGYQFVQAARAAIDYADQIDAVASANEVSIGTVLKLSESIAISGGKVEDTGKMFATFTNKIDEAAKGSKAARESFAKLGITVDDLGKLSQQQLFEKAIRGFADPKMGDVITRNATAMELFGKAAKGVEINKLANEYLANENTFKKQEQAFKAIGDAMDKLDTATQKTKQRMATDLAPILTGSINFFDTLINGWTRLEGHIEKAARKQEEFIAKQQGAPVWKPAGMIGTPMSAEEVSKLPAYQARVIEQTPEEKAAAEKAKALAESLKQQLLQMRLQTDEIGKQKSEYEKVKLLFDATGKYYDLANTSTAKQVLEQAKLLDQKREEHELAKAIYEVQKADAIEQARKIKAGEDALKQVIIRRQQEQEEFKRRVEDIKITAERLNYESQLVMLSDTQKQKALEYFDLRQRMMRMAKDEVGLSEQQLQAYQEAEQASINAQEQTRRAQRTFQAGWSNAYENFMERAKDSATLGAEAFNSMTSSMESAMDNFVRTGKLSFKELAASIIQDLIRIQIKAQMTTIFGGGGAGGIFGGIFGKIFGGGGDGGVSMSAGAYGIESNPYLNFATGGNAYDNQPYIVGERGAELFVPRTNGTVIPNHSLSSMMGSQPQNVYNGTVVQNMSAIDTQSAVQFLAKNKQAVWSANQSAQRSLPMSRG